MVKYSNTTASQIAEIVNQSELESFCSPTSDHCTYVAYALNDIFDIDSYYVAVEPGQKYRRPAHIAVVKNGVIIDSTGVVSQEYMKDYAVSGLKADEIEKADWGQADTGLLDQEDLNDGDSQLLSNIKDEIIRVSEDIL